MVICYHDLAAMLSDIFIYIFFLSFFFVVGLMLIRANKPKAVFFSPALFLEPLQDV